MPWRRSSSALGGVTVELILTNVALSSSVVAVCALCIFRAKALTWESRERCNAIFAASTSYMSLVAAAVTKSWSLVVNSADTVPTAWPAVSFTALTVLFSVFGCGLIWPGWSGGAAKLSDVDARRAASERANLAVMAEPRQSERTVNVRRPPWFRYSLVPLFVVAEDDVAAVRRRLAGEDIALRHLFVGEAVILEHRRLAAEKLGAAGRADAAAA